MPKKTDHKKRREVAEKKKVISAQMLKQGKSNSEIQAVMHKRFKSGIGPDYLATIRAELGTSGANRGVKKTKRKDQALTKISPVTLMHRSNGASPELKLRLDTLFDQMHFEGIEAVGIKKEGTIGHVAWTQHHETMIELGTKS